LKEQFQSSAYSINDFGVINVADTKIITLVGIYTMLFYC